MDLRTLILPSKTVEFDYDGVKDLSFSLSFISKSELDKMRKTHTSVKKNKYTKAYEDELDQDAFLKEYVPSVLKGWRGLTVDAVQSFIIVDEAEDLGKEIPYTEENAYNLLTNSIDLDNWVSEKISEVENFRSNK